MNAFFKTAGLYAVALSLAGCAPDAPLAVYGFRGESPWRTVKAGEDGFYQVGDMARVRGRYRPGGTAGGAVIVLEVLEPSVATDGVLDAYPIKRRSFYLNKLDISPSYTPEVADVTGNIIADDVFGYGYLLDVLSADFAQAPDLDEARVRSDLEAAGAAVKNIELDDITRRLHHQYNRGYKITADADAAAITWAGTDYEGGYMVVKAELEQLPPYDDPRIYRTLDVYLVYPVGGGGCLWAVVCVGGYFLE